MSSSWPILHTTHDSWSPFISILSDCIDATSCIFVTINHVFIYLLPDYLVHAWYNCKTRELFVYCTFFISDNSINLMNMTFCLQFTDDFLLNKLSTLDYCTPDCSIVRFYLFCVTLLCCSINMYLCWLNVLSELVSLEKLENGRHWPV